MSEEIISFIDVSKTFKSFGKPPVCALQKVNLSASAGDVYGFAGLNGAGKTTGIKTLLGLCKHDSGEVKLFGKHFNECEPSRIGFASEIASLPGYLDASEYLGFLSKLSNKIVSKERIESLLVTVGLDKVGEKRISTFSKGMKQRLSLASSIIHDPELVVLDEPSSGLDPMGRKMLMQLLMTLKKQGKTVFFSTHILSDIKEICNKVGILHNGRMLFEGDTNKFCDKYSSIEFAFEKLINDSSEVSC